MLKFFLIIEIMLLTAFTAVNAQQTHQPKVEGQGSLRAFIFAPDRNAGTTSARSSLKVSTKPKEATLSSPQAVRQNIFPGSNGGGGVPRNAAAARKSTAKAAPAGQLPSSASSKDAAQNDKAGESAKAAAKPIDPAAQGKEPSLHFEKPKATTPKN